MAKGARVWHSAGAGPVSLLQASGSALTTPHLFASSCEGQQVRVRPSPGSDRAVGIVQGSSGECQGQGRAGGQQREQREDSRQLETLQASLNKSAEPQAPQPPAYLRPSAHKVGHRP
ncbi:hypothetical protein HaLaN_20730 [Haematococcus lacustris]|uniref:Uncharacterized protein n=1 Tax=Haematococcus lacustris TaxID=44745 RepID=A0A699ZPS3_HAELA|nr:hypothetical protein HaLaN_20730 [Haematococcus lacustris]